MSTPPLVACITREQFAQGIKGFASISDLIHDGWSIDGDIMCKKVVLHTELQTGGKTFKSEEPCDGSVTLHDVVTENDDAVLTCSEDWLTLIYHVVYSESYGVPVLYFNAYHSTGQLVTLPQVWKLGNFTAGDKTLCQDVGVNPWQVLTQGEHPVLGRPFYFIHPCKTAQLMHSVCGIADATAYIISWLSLVAPLVKLTVPLHYASHGKFAG